MSERLKLGADELDRVFPFHLGFDEDCRLVHAGASITKLLPGLAVGSELGVHFHIERPDLPWSYAAIHERSDVFFLLRSIDRDQLKLRGQMLALTEPHRTVFLGSAWTLEIDEFSGLGLSVQDFALHDPILDLLFLASANASALADASLLAERLSDANRSLERRVEARTAELKDAYLDLSREVRDRERVEEELHLARKLESIGLLATGIAHEINTPTQYVGDNTRFFEQSFAELAPLLKKAEELADAVSAGTGSSALAAELKSALDAAEFSYLVEEIPRAIDQSLEGIERVRKIIVSMKEFSHPGREGWSCVDLNHAIENSIAVAANEWKYVAEIETDLDPELPPVSCLPGEFNQVILNILVNAAHAIADVVGDGAASKGTITISTRRDGESVEIRIADTGSGIPKEARHKIFDPFVSTKEVGKGTGQGLSIAHRVVVKNHGGTLQFATEMGEGTTFIIRLPLAQPCLQETDG